MRHAQGIMVVCTLEMLCALWIELPWFPARLTHVGNGLLDISMARTLLTKIAQAAFTRIFILHENIYPMRVENCLPNSLAPHYLFNWRNVNCRFIMLDGLYPADRYLNFFSVAKSSTPRQRCVKSQLASLPPVLGILSNLCSIWKISLFIYIVSKTLPALPMYCPGPAHSERRARQIPLCCPSFGWWRLYRAITPPRGSSVSPWQLHPFTGSFTSGCSKPGLVRMLMPPISGLYTENSNCYHHPWNIFHLSYHSFNFGTLWRRSRALWSSVASYFGETHVQIKYRW